MGVAFKVNFQDSHYNPETGRFLSEDPIGFAGQDENLYRFVRNNSINLTDPYGEFPSNMEEVGQCLGGNYTGGQITPLKSTIKFIESEIRAAQRSLIQAENNSCLDPAAVEFFNRRIRQLRNNLRGQKKRLQELIRICSDFPTDIFNNP